MRLVGYTLALTSLVACAGHRASNRGWQPPVSDDPVLADIGIDLSEHHLEQHPDPTCRVDWRPQHLRVSTGSSAAGIENTARRYLGTPYVYGGTGVNGLDCSGFVNRVYAAHGYDLPRTSREQAQVGLEVSPGDLEPGDLLFFTVRERGGTIDHVGLYLGDGTFIHAARGKGEVSLARLDAPYYRERFALARRILVMPPGRYSDQGGRARDEMAFSSRGEVDSTLGGVGPCRELSYGSGP